MAKKKHSAPKSIPASNVATSSLASKVPTALASLMVGAGVMGKPEAVEGLKFDGAFLEDLRSALPPESASRFGPWLERFASFCKELEKKNIALADGAAGLQSQAVTQAEAFDQERQSLLDTAENDREALKQEEEELYKQRDLLFTDRQQLDEQKQALMPRLESAAAKESELADRELTLLTRELDARSGFASIKQQTLEALKSEVRQLESERDHLLQDVANQKESLTRGQQEKDMALQQRERELSAKALKHEATRLRLQRQQDDLDQEKSQLLAAIDEGMEGERNQHQRDLERKDKSQERLHQQMDVLKDRLAGFQELMAVLGDKDPQTLLDELQELRRANSAFRASGSTADTQRLDLENAGLREQLAASESRLRDLVPELEQSKIELSRKRMGAAELETLAAEKRALEKHKQLLSVHLGDLSARIDQLTDASKAKSAFPQLSAMDSRDDCRFSPVLEPVPDDLEAFANELQQRIAQAEGPKTPLYYRIADIRTLLGGLAMSQLHVFQGISGTGKTSLAKAFAKAMGGNCTTIAVQAGWRDRDDLLGHYNAFEKRFYEKDCLQALYQAQTEAFKDRCNIILLDEMNLSRPEQYFAEFLSALEINSASERLISLSENCMADAPRLLKEQRKILVPENLWFIGTANQDETTNELADKTYDRAHVMILPRQEETFAIQKLPPIRYSFSSLQDRFDKAIAVNQDDVQELLEQLKYSDLTSVLAESFDFSWGNRFERQAKRFIPVMIECGASQQDALDHLLSTRVMRSGKVTKRHDISVEQLGRVEDALDQFWKQINGGEAAKSKQLIVEDRRRKERGA
jgi:hypothetical protein